MMNTGTARYKKSQITSSSSKKTVLLLYDGAINFLRSAINEVSENGNIPEKTRLIERAVNVIDYLQSCLNKENGGEIAQNLDSLYEYMLVRLTEANLRNDEGKINEVIRLLVTIREGWAAICSNNKKVQEAPIGNYVNSPDGHSYRTREISVKI
ncbi:MAG: flagellar export chaperone FliS [Nitrospirota bacterium]